MTVKTPESWHLSKSIPLSILFALLVQIITFAWWASNLDAKVAQHNIQIIELKEVDRTNNLNYQRTNDMLSRLDERILSHIKAIEKFDKILASSKFSLNP